MILQQKYDLFLNHVEPALLSLSPYSCWFKKATLLALRRAAATTVGQGDIQGVEHRLLLISH